MLDINFIRDNTDLVKKAAQEKGIQIDLDELLNLDSKRRELTQKVDDLRHQRNEAAKKRDVEKGKEIKIQLDTWEKELKESEEHFNHLMLYVPNIPAKDSPVGPDSDSNKEIFKWGEIPEFDFKVRNHVELGKILDIIDLEQGTKVSGFRGYYLKNEGAKLHWAILNYSLEKIVKAGFIQMVPPTLVHERVLIGSGHFPFGKENVYQIANPGKLETGEEIKNPLYLTGTSEPSLLAYYLDKTVPEEELPIKVCALTQCYRSEVGDYGKDTKGLYRLHEFTKVEQVVVCRNNLEESEELFNQMQKLSEEILQELNIPYHVIATSTGDMGAGKYRMNDLEAWMPGRGKYGETHSNSNLTDWQARRLNLKFKSKDNRAYFCYTLNNTVIASPRILIAILENFQQKDGAVLVPGVLQKYTGFSEIKAKREVH
ncbi:serine--tRNA ligase [Candidatus Daviesbacteria bacterium]|nr:serine--tRNA ligase [Candidatus Daviesbacteria bacterium]